MTGVVEKYEFAGTEIITEGRNNLIMKKMLSAEDSEDSVSVVWVKIDGKHLLLKTHSKMRLYFILEGSFTFIVDEGREVLLSKNDLLTLPQSTIYSFWGVGEYLVMNTPAFKDGDDEYI